LENRYRAHVPFKDLMIPFSVSQPSFFAVGRDANQLGFSASKAYWEKYAAATTKIFYIISKN